MGAIEARVEADGGAGAPSAIVWYIFARIGLVATERVHLESAARLAELDHTRLKIIERTLDETALFLVMSEEIVPKRVLAQDFRVTKNDNTILRASESDIQSTRVVQETDALMLVTPDTAKDDIILFSALECVYTGHFDLFVEVLLEGAVELHIIDDIRALSFVWRDDTNLGRNNAGLEELGDNLFDI